ncbi:MAG: Ig-like domain-containing protein [Paludibacteraceae bacterium]|nr:Ig-like domain-containing protein [Paludibacteraceae bacterium]
MLIALVASAMLNATGAEVKLVGTIYEKVTSLQSLAAGDTIMLVCEKGNVAAGTTLKTSGSSSYLDTVPVRLADHQATADNALQLVVGKNGNYYTLTTTDKQTVGAHTTKYIDLGSTTGTNDWTITFDADGNASIKANLTAKVYIQYNVAAPRFTCYDGKQTAIQIYKKTDKQAGEVHVDNVHIDPATLNIRKGASAQLKAVITPATADNQKVSWTVAQSDIAEVTDGLVTAKSIGETTITVTTEDGNKQATCAVTVTDSVHVSGISVTPSVAGMKELTTLQLTATIQPAEADNQKVIWSSSDETVATVDANGIVTAARFGQVTITATSDEFPTMQATTTITVTAQPGDRYHLMTADSTLHDGDLIVFYNSDKQSASAGLVDSRKYLSGMPAVVAGEDLIVEESVPMLLTKNGSYWRLSINGSPIGHSATSANSVDFNGKSSDFTISIDEQAMAVVKSQTSSNPQFYCNSSGNFRLYNSTSMSPTQIYRKVANPDVPIAVESVELDIDTLYLRAGEEDVLEAYITPKNAKVQDVEWGSLDESVATVAEGEVSAIAQGETKVWVRTVDGEFTDTCFVKVYASLNQPDVTWNRLQSLDSLKEGTRVFFASVRAGEDYIMGIYDYDNAKSNIQGAAATFSEDRHKVTASESYAYTVHIENGKYMFTDLDGSYLCDYNLKNLSAQDNLDNKARWTGKMSEDFAFTFTNAYNTGYVIYNNHNSDIFCCYNAYDASNMAYIALYADNAPEWVEPVRVPELNVLVDKDTITDKVDFGNVIYDDTWGTEVNPYEEAKTLTFVTKYLTDDIHLSLAKGTAFTLYTETVQPTGGKASVQFSTDTKGKYSDTLYIICDTIVRKITLTATAMTEEEIKPSISFSTTAVDLYLNLDNNFNDLQMFTFTTTNMVKNLYVKWENTTGNSIPDRQGESVEVLAVNDYVYYGSSTNMGTVNYTDAEVYIDATAYTEGTYTSTLLFYTPDANDKSKNAFEQRVTMTIHVSYDPTPTNLDSQFVNSANTQLNKLIKNNHLLIYRFGKWYTANGQIVNR